MVKYRIKILPKAQADIESICQFIQNYSAQGTLAWIDAFESKITQLAVNADACGPAEESEHFEIPLQQVLFKTKRGSKYRLIFTIRHDEVLILRVRGPGQAPVNPIDIE